MMNYQRLPLTVNDKQGLSQDQTRLAPVKGMFVPVSVCGLVHWLCLLPPVAGSVSLES